MRGANGTDLGTDDLRVALCLAGQMRTFRKCYGYLVENVLDPLDPDVFVHTESSIGITNRLGMQASGRGDEQGTVNRSTIERLYDPLRVEITEPFSAADRREFRGVRVPDKLIEAEPDHWQGNIPNFYEIYRCNELKRDHETEQGFRYDVVIYLRPDLLVPQELPDIVLSNPQKLWHTQTHPKLISDKMAVSSSENMDYYSSVWKQLSDYWEEPLGGGGKMNHRSGERLLRQHMARSEIEVERFDIGSETLRSREFIREKIKQEVSPTTRAGRLQKKLSAAIANPGKVPGYLVRHTRAQLEERRR